MGWIPKVGDIDHANIRHGRVRSQRGTVLEFCLMLEFVNIDAYNGHLSESWAFNFVVHGSMVCATGVGV